MTLTLTFGRNPPMWCAVAKSGRMALHGTPPGHPWHSSWPPVARQHHPRHGSSPRVMQHAAPDPRNLPLATRPLHLPLPPAPATCPLYLPPQPREPIPAVACPLFGCSLGLRRRRGWNLVGQEIVGGRVKVGGRRWLGAGSRGRVWQATRRHKIVCGQDGMRQCVG